MIMDLKFSSNSTLAEDCKFSYTLDFKFSKEFQNIEHNKSFISTKISDKWNVYSISSGENIIEDYDSSP